MKRFACLVLISLVAAGCVTTGRGGNKVMVVIETSKGNMTVELWRDKAPKTVENFLRYVDSGFYESLVFHRIIRGFMIQGGGFDLGMAKKDTLAPVKNEASSEVPNSRGTIAMARTPDPHSATSQFFINHADNSFLDQKDQTPEGYGYCVFGKLVDGYDVLDAIAEVPTGIMGPFRDVPVEPVVIKSIRRNGTDD